MNSFCTGSNLKQAILKINIAYLHTLTRVSNCTDVELDASTIYKFPDFSSVFDITSDDYLLVMDPRNLLLLKRS